jgi:hypothetical protein
MDVFVSVSDFGTIVKDSYSLSYTTKQQILNLHGVRSFWFWRRVHEWIWQPSLWTWYVKKVAFLLPSCQQCSYSNILLVSLCLTSLIWRNQSDLSFLNLMTTSCYYVSTEGVIECRYWVPLPRNKGRFIYIKARWKMCFYSTIRDRQRCWNHIDRV